MDLYRGPATLEWRANDSFTIGPAPLELRVFEDWTAEATPAGELSEEERDGFEFFLELGSPYTVRFPDDSICHVTVAGDADRITLVPVRDEEAAA
jgi:hypothetical protein